MPYFYMILVVVLVSVTLLGRVIARRSAMKKKESARDPLNPELEPVPPLASPLRPRSEQLGDDLINQVRH